MTDLQAKAFTIAHYRREQPCPECGGSGGVDSGGVTPWDSAIYVACQFCAGRGKVTLADLVSFVLTGHIDGRRVSA